MELIQTLPKQKSEPLNIEDKENLNDIFRKLVKTLHDNPSAYFLTAPQIGINKNAAVILIPGLNPVLLVNPVIVKKNWEIPFMESNISFPNKIFETFRYAHVTVKADNFANEEPIKFGIKEELAKEILKDIENYAHPNIHQAVAIQQAVDVLNGKDSSDRKGPQSFDFKKYGRNQIVEIEKNGETKKIKYKKSQPFLKDGWKIK